MDYDGDAQNVLNEFKAANLFVERFLTGLPFVFMTSILGRVKALALSAGRHSSHLTDRMTCSLHLKAIVITIKMSEP